MQSVRESSALAGQLVMFDGAGVTVQLPMLASNAATAAAPGDLQCKHAGDRQVQASIDGPDVVRCCSCGEVAASAWTPPALNFIDDIPRALSHAYSWSSMDPEKRFAQTREEYAATLTADLEAFRRAAAAGNTTHMLAAEFEQYRAGLRKRWTAAVSSDSRCASWMVTGRSNFPVARMTKRNEIASRRWSEVFEFRTRATTAIMRKLRPDLAPIRASDDDAIERLRAKLGERQEQQEKMKAANAAIRKHAKAGADSQIEALMQLGMSEGRARALLQPDQTGGIGFGDYEIRNNGAEIRRLQQRLAHVEAAQSSPATTRDGSHARIEDCPADNRVRLFFPGKPDEPTRATLKQNGFRWAPSIGCWQAYRKPRTLQFAQKIAGAEDGNS